MQRHSRCLIEELQRLNAFDLVVIHPHADVKVFPPHANFTEIALPGIDPGRNYLLECYKYSKRTYGVIQNYPDAVIYSQGLSVWHRIRTVAERVVINPHGLESFQGSSFRMKIQGTPFRIILRYLLLRARRVVSLGKKLTWILTKRVKVPSEKIIMIPNATYLENGYKISNRQFTSDRLKLLYVGRFVREKGIEILLEVIDQINKKEASSKIVLNLVGNGPLLNRLKRKFEAHNIIFFGNLTDDAHLQNLFKASDVLVLPSFAEGMPTVILEAMRYGLPAIATHVGAVPELLEGHSELLIPPNDQTALADAIIRFCQLTKEDRQILSENIYGNLSKKYLWPEVARQYQDLFKGIQKSFKASIFAGDNL